MEKLTETSSNGGNTLSSSDFYVQRDPNGVETEDMLCTNIQGTSLVLFHLPACEHSQALIPIFNQLSSVVSGCSYWLADMRENTLVTQTSWNTKYSVHFCPDIILYYDGKPCKRYPVSAPHTLESLIDFVVNDPFPSR